MVQPLDYLSALPGPLEYSITRTLQFYLCTRVGYSILKHGRGVWTLDTSFQPKNMSNFFF